MRKLSLGGCKSYFANLKESPARFETMVTTDLPSMTREMDTNVICSFWSPAYLPSSFVFFFAAARLYPTRQAPGPPPNSAGGDGFSGGVGSSGGGGGFSSRTGFLRRSHNSKTTKTSSTSTNAGGPIYQQQNANFANYQNCTIVRSHTSHANYGYVKVAPKILIFPIFVQVGWFYNIVSGLLISCEL